MPVCWQWWQWQQPGSGRQRQAAVAGAHRGEHIFGGVLSCIPCLDLIRPQVQHHRVHFICTQTCVGKGGRSCICVLPTSKPPPLPPPLVADGDGSLPAAMADLTSTHLRRTRAPTWLRRPPRHPLPGAKQRRLLPKHLELLVRCDYSEISTNFRWQSKNKIAYRSRLCCRSQVAAFLCRNSRSLAPFHCLAHSYLSSITLHHLRSSPKPAAACTPPASMPTAAQGKAGALASRKLALE